MDWARLWQTLASHNSRAREHDRNGPVISNPCMKVRYRPRSLLSRLPYKKIFRIHPICRYWCFHLWSKLNLDKKSDRFSLEKALMRATYEFHFFIQTGQHASRFVSSCFLQAGKRQHVFIACSFLRLAFVFEFHPFNLFRFVVTLFRVSELLC